MAEIPAMKGLIKAVAVVFGCVVLLFVLIALIAGRGFRHDKIAVVKLEGVIVDADDIRKELQSLGERDDVKAVIIRINSPGGAVAPSQEINSDIVRLRQKKKVIASMSSVAASGALYAAVASDKVLADPGTITGSIGVIIEFVNVEGLLGKIGLQGTVVKTGKFKDTGSPLRKMTGEEAALLQGVINEVNSQFINAVAEGRHLKREDVARIADGRIFTGAEALRLGLVDKLGGLTDAVDLAAELSGIKGKPDVIYTGKKPFSLLKALTGETSLQRISDILTGMRVMYLAPAL